ncbi:MAG: hypothetical protein EOQ69_11130 [Mesorhizobium sp.]|nr:MAG: hypothetical protein EOQ69_11130 [Mesorhizobium sp.]
MAAASFCADKREASDLAAKHLCYGRRLVRLVARIVFAGSVGFKTTSCDDPDRAHPGLAPVVISSLLKANAFVSYGKRGMRPLVRSSLDVEHV